MRRTGWVVILGMLASSAAGLATTVDPPTLPQMVSRADRIFVGEAVSSRSYWTGSSIHTDVTFRVSETVKGANSPMVLLTFLGGAVGDIALEVAGTPRFAPGDEQVLFTTDRARQANPIVGFWHGRVLITRDLTTRTARVLRFDQTPFSRPAAVTERPAETSAALVVPITLASFLAEVRRLVREGPPQ